MEDGLPEVDDTRGLPAHRVDPWAVVDHHARQSAELAPESMSETARLALYAAAAPDVIGATAVRRGQLGLGRPSDYRGWWMVQMPGPPGSSPRALVWNAAGPALVERPATTGRRMLLAAITAGVPGMVGLVDLLSGLAILPAALLAAIAAYITREWLPSYTPIGSWPGDERYQKALAELVDRYERMVGG